MAAEVAIEQFVSEEVNTPFHLSLVPDLVRLVPEMRRDDEIRMQAASFIGSVLAGQEVELEQVATPESSHPISNLLDAIQRAAYDDDPTAYQMIGANVSTSMFEQTVKAGVGRDTELQTDEAGRILQWGQYMESVQANNLRRLANGSLQMKDRAAAEIRNGLRMQQGLDQGDLQDNYFVVISRAPDDMSIKQMSEEGFYTDTMSFTVQATTLKDGRLVTEPAFVAGVVEADGPRHDGQAVASLGEWLGVDLLDLSSTELLDTPLLVSKKLMPNGVVDIVEVCDDATGGFFGEAKPRQDYIEFRQESFEREEMLTLKKQAIVQELVSEVATLRDPLHASRRLHKITEKHMVQQAMWDREIDPRVFGPAAVVHIEQGRLYFEQGRMEEGLVETRKAEKVADATDCPTGKQDPSADELGKNEDGKSDESGDCEFISKECPRCHKKNVKTVISKGKIKGDCGCTAKLK